MAFFLLCLRCLCTHTLPFSHYPNVFALHALMYACIPCCSLACLLSPLAFSDCLFSSTTCYYLLPSFVYYLLLSLCPFISFMHYSSLLLSLSSPSTLLPHINIFSPISILYHLLIFSLMLCLNLVTRHPIYNHKPVSICACMPSSMPCMHAACCCAHCTPSRTYTRAAHATTCPSLATPNLGHVVDRRVWKVEGLGWTFRPVRILGFHYGLALPHYCPSQNSIHVPCVLGLVLPRTPYPAHWPILIILIKQLMPLFLNLPLVMLCRTGTGTTFCSACARVLTHTACAFPGILNCW